MLHNHTLEEIKTSINTGVEYEIALFYKLLENKPLEQNKVKDAINVRKDKRKIEEIILYTNTDKILEALKERGMILTDISFETQNDNVGPADIVLYTKNSIGRPCFIGLSIKYANTCTLNVTGRKFITDEQIEVLKEKYIKEYIPEFKRFMRMEYGHAENWHRKRHPLTYRMIDDIRDAVIQNWPNIGPVAK